MPRLPHQPRTGSEHLRALTPLLEAIAREIDERSVELERLLVERGRLPSGAVPARGLLDAECSAHRVALRLARKELERLGCVLVSSRPCTFCIEVDDDAEKSVVFWRITPPT